MLEPVSAAALPEPISRKSSFPAWLAGLWAALGLAMAIGAVALIHRERTAALHLWEARLSLLAQEKAAIVRQWIAEREGDARLLAGLPAIRARLAGGAAGGGLAGSEIEESVRESFRRISETYSYRAIALFDADGRTVVEIGEPLLEESERLADASRRDGRGEHALLQGPSQGRFALALAEPVLPPPEARGGTSTPLGAVLLIPNPEPTLFSLFKKDLLPTLSDEAYIVVSRGETLRYIRPRRALQSGSSAGTSAGEPAYPGPIPLALSGGLREFVDGRGLRVLAAARPVTEIGAAVVVQVDRDEALSALTENALWIGFSAVALFLLAVFVSLSLRRQVAAQREREIAEQETRYRTLLEQAQDGVVLDCDGLIEFANPAAIKMFGGSSHEDFLRRRFLDFIAPDSQEKVSSIRGAHLAGEAAPDRYEIAALRSNGARFDVEISEALTELHGRPAVQATLRDITLRREIERALLQSEKRYRLLFERNLAGVYRSTPEGKILECNEAFARIMGYDDTQEAMAQPASAFYTTPETRDRLLSLLQSGGSLTNFEARGRRKDGTEIWVLETVSLVPGDGAQPDVLEGTLIDISERKRAEEALRESQERFRLLTEASLEGILISDRGVATDANRQFASLFGYEPEEVTGLSLLEFAAPESQTVVAQRVLENREGTYEAVCRRRDGTTFPAEISARAMPYEGRTIRVTVVRNISERRKAHDELTRSEERHRLIFDLAPIGIYQSRRDGSLITANARLSQMLGYDSPQELLSVNLKDIYANPAERDALINRFAAADGARRMEIEWKKKDGSTIWVEVNAHTIASGPGEGPRFEGFVNDVTERRRGEEERRTLEHRLVQSQKIEAVGQLAGGIAHDFNNILTAITGYTELLMGSLEVQDPRRAQAEQIRLAARRATALTQQLLAFSRRQVLEPKILDLSKVVSDMEEMLRRLIGEHIELRVRTAPNLWPVQADPSQLEQAVLNLVVNARDAMPEGGKLAIETANAELDEAYATERSPAVPGQYGMIAVTDTGSGMPPDVRARLFEPFFTTKGPGKGTGLGLSTTYGIVKQSGGYIWCYSEPGRGTSFKIYLPRVAARDSEAIPASPPAAQASPSAQSGQETILLVEDEPEVRSLVLRLLKLQGYTVVAAANPDEALAITRDFRGAIDLMVTDVVMPGMSGRQLADRLAGMRPEMKVLFVSGYTDDAIVHHGMLDPGTAFLQKPFTPQALARKVREVIEAPPGQFKVS